MAWGTPDLAVTEPGLSIQCSFLEISTWNEAEGGVRREATVEVREEGPLLGPPTCPPSEGTQGCKVPMDSGAFILIIIRLQ